MQSQLRFFFFMMLFLYLMSSSPREEEQYPSDINVDHILDQFREEVNQSRHLLLEDYSMGYGNLSGFHLSYHDAVLNRNASHWPFPDHDGPFIEDEEYSILPNIISKKASDVLNTEDECVILPKNRKDINKPWNGKKINDGAYPLNVSGVVRGNFRKSMDKKHELIMIDMPISDYLKPFYDYKMQEKQRREDERRRNNNAGDDGDDHINYSVSEKSLFQNDNSVSLDLLQFDHREGNITYEEGQVKMSFFNFESENDKYHINGTTIVGITLKINDNTENNEHKISLTGVYHQDSGNLIAASRSSKFSGVYALPMLNLAPGDFFNRTRYALTSEFNQTNVEDLKFENVEDLIDNVPNCEYIGYFHFESTNLTRSELKDIDLELSNPIGRPHKNVPPLVVSKALLYSPDCAIVVEMDDIKGPRNEIYNDNLKTVILIAILVVFAQIWLLIRQMSVTSTPSTLSRIAFWTIVILNMADGSLSVIALLCSMVFTELYLQFAVCAFLAFTCSAIYEMKYSIQIYSSQVNERPLDWRTVLQGTSIDERQEQRERNQGTQEQPLEGGLPLPATTPTPNAVGLADEQTIGAELYTRHFLSMIAFLFIVLNVTTWPKKPRMIFEYVFSTIFNSYWFPQIYRNVLRGSRKSFTSEFIICTSILRLIPLIYISVFPNPFYHHQDFKFVVFLIFWISLQVVILFLQDVLGPRWLLPEKYLPKTYDYHPVLTKSDIENGFNVEQFITEGSSATEEDNRTIKYKVDCAICMQELEVPVINDCVSSDGDNHSHHDASVTFNAMNLMARRSYMVTPCKHIFHTNCLENWMMYKLQCPVCRNSLPPL